MKKIALALTGAFLITVTYMTIQNNKETKTVLNVGFPGYWKDLIPALQHTALADAILHNQFEALVGGGHGGAIVPHAAKSWKISEDKKVIVFKIDTSKKFSNGKKLKAKHFKESWEHGLSLESKSANSSLQDVIYKIVGYQDFKNTGKLSGVSAPDDETLIVEFEKPFRMGLAHLMGARMAAFIIEDGKYLGTGPYIIHDSTEKKVHLTKNPFNKSDAYFERINIEVVPSSEAESALQSGKIDLYAFAEITKLKDCFLENKKTGCQSGMESRHMTLNVNGKKGRFFSNPNYRKALQYLLHQGIEDSFPNEEKFKTKVDPQIYLPLQSGRIESDRANEIIEDGKKYVDDFIKATEKNPLFFATFNKHSWIKGILENKGVKLSQESVKIKGSRVLEMFYKTHEPDLLFTFASVASGDPDGIYHVLGKHGSISSPMIQRSKVAEILESGRSITDPSEVNRHYKKVSEVVLEEVPFVHLGFLKTVVVFRKDRINVRKKFVERSDNQFTAYEAL